MPVQRLVAVVTATCATFALASCGSAESDSGTSNDEYIIMMSGGDEAGPLTEQVRTGVLAARAAVKAVNASGGINGRQIKFIESPDLADPTKAVTNLRSQIAKDKPDAYMGPGSSVVSAAVAPILRDSDILFLNQSSIPETNDPEGNPLAFNMTAPFETIVESFIPAIEDLGAENVAILNGNSAYAATFGKTAEALLKDAGFDVAREEYDSAALDMTAQISKLQASDADVLVFNGYGAPVGYVLDGITKLGWDVPILADSAVTATPLVTQDPPDGVLGTPAVANLRFQVVKSLDRNTASPQTMDAVDLIKAEGSITTPLNTCLQYDAVMLIQAAAKTADSTDAADIAAALEQEGGTSEAKTLFFAGYQYSPDSHEPEVSLDEFSFVEPSKIVDGQLG